MEEKKNGKKWLLIIFLILLTFILGIGGYFIYTKPYISNNDDKKQTNDNDDKKQTNDNNLDNKNFELKKFSNYSHNITQISVSYNNEYYLFDGYNRLSNTHVFTGFKDNSVVKDINEDVRNFEGTDIYYSFSQNLRKFVDYKNEGLSNENYESLEHVKNEIFIAKKDGKYGLIDKYGKELLPYEYLYIENITTDRNNDKKSNSYLFVIKDNKSGIMDLNGKIIVPLEYDFTFYEWYGQKIYSMNNVNSRAYESNGKYYFMLKKNNKFYILDSNNNKILESDKKIDYVDNIDKLIITNNNNNKIKSVDFYSFDGKLVKKIDIDENWDFENYDKNLLLSKYDNKVNFILIRNKNSSNKVYLLDKDLNIKEFDNLYYEEEKDSEGTIFYRYLINDKFYLLKRNDKFDLYDYKTKKIIEKNYSNVYYMYYTPTQSLILCKDNNKSCGLLGFNKEFITDFNYEYKDEKGFVYLKNNNKYRFYLDFNDELTCDDTFDINTLIPGHKYGNYYQSLDKKIYNNNCKKITEKNTRNITSLDNGYSIVEIDNGIDDKYDYEIYDKNDNKITYENFDNAQFILYIGYTNNKLFFLMDKGIYSMDI